MHLREWADREEMSAAEMGRRLGVVNSTVWKWLYGFSSPSEEMWRQIGRLTRYEVTPNDHVHGISLTDEQRMELIRRDANDDAAGTKTDG